MLLNCFYRRHKMHIASEALTYIFFRDSTQAKDTRKDKSDPRSVSHLVRLVYLRLELAHLSRFHLET